jgi:hypothetical protein
MGDRNLGILTFKVNIHNSQTCLRGRHGRDRMVVGFITTSAISVRHH